MGRCWILVATVIFASPLLYAQNGPDFSGAYLRKSSLIATKPSKDWSGPEARWMEELQQESEEGFPLVLEVKQTSDLIEFTETRNGVQLTHQCYFRGVKPPKAHSAVACGAEFKKGTLLLKYTVNLAGTSGRSNALPEKHSMKLSSDSQTLTISGMLAETGTYARQPSLDSTLALVAEAPRTNKCAYLLTPPPGVKFPTKYEGGAAWGSTTYRKSDTCVSFDAALSGDFFKTVKRTEAPSGAVFRLSDQTISVFSSDLLLEISFRTVQCGPIDLLKLSIPFERRSTPSEFLNLLFQVKWMGSATRELGEIPSELYSQP